MIPPTLKTPASPIFEGTLCEKTKLKADFSFFRAKNKTLFQMFAEAIRATAAPAGLDLTSPILALVAAVAVAHVYPALRPLVIPE